MATALDSTVLKHRVSADCLDSSHFYILWRVLNLVLSPWHARSLEDLAFRKMLKGPAHAVVVSGPPVYEKPCAQALAERPGSLWGCLPRLSALHPVQTRVLLPPHSELWAQGSGLPLCYWLFLVLGWGVKLVSCSLLSPKSPWSSSHLATQPEFYYLQTNAVFVFSSSLPPASAQRRVLLFEVREKAASLSVRVSPSVSGWRLVCTLWPLEHVLLNSRAQLLEFKNIRF